MEKSKTKEELSSQMQMAFNSYENKEVEVIAIINNENKER